MSTITTRVEDPVGTLTFSNTPRNCLDVVFLKGIDQQFSRLLDHPRVKSIIITADHVAGGGCFCAGMDVKVIHALAHGPMGAACALLEQMMALGLKIDRSPKPVAAYVDGPCFGGGLELALCCDLIIAGPKAQFALPEIKLGIFPGWGGTQRLPRKIGFAPAAKMILSGQVIDTNTASAIGLINGHGSIEDAHHMMAEVAMDPDMVLRRDEEKKVETVSLPKSLAAGHSMIAARTAYNTMSEGCKLSLEDGLKREMENFLMVLDTQDAREGLDAFVQKRKPNFTAVY